MTRSPPHDGAGQWSFQATITGLHVPLPRLKFWMSLNIIMVECDIFTQIVVSQDGMVYFPAQAGNGSSEGGD